MSYALFEDGKIPVADPTAIEERISNASIVLAINSYKELCSMHLTGVTLTSPRLIQSCTEMAAERSRRIVEYIKHTLEENKKQRDSGVIKGFSEAIKLSNVTSNFHDATSIEKMQESDESADDEIKCDEPLNLPINKIDKDTVSTDKFNATSSDEEESSDEEMPPVKNTKIQKKMEVIEGSSGEEEETIILK